MELSRGALWRLSEAVSMSGHTLYLSPWSNVDIGHTERRLYTCTTRRQGLLNHTLNAHMTASTTNSLFPSQSPKRYAITPASHLTYSYFLNHRSKPQIPARSTLAYLYSKHQACGKKQKLETQNVMLKRHRNQSYGKQQALPLIDQGPPPLPPPQNPTKSAVPPVAGRQPPTIFVES